MSVGFSPFNITFNLDPFNSITSLSSQYVKCSFNTTGVLSFNCYTITNTFLLPLYFFILYKAFQQRHHPRETSVVDTNLVTYNLAVMEIASIFGLIIYCFGINMSAPITKLFGRRLYSFFFPGQTLFHCLACMEHYLAVVYPTIYRRLRTTSGLRMRLISCGCVWLICLLISLMEVLPHPHIRFIFFNLVLSISIIIVFGCYIFMLHVLKSPKPGEAAREQGVVDRSKQKASCIIKVILGAQVLRTIGFFLSYTLPRMVVMMPREVCSLCAFGLWLTLPGNLVLPLLLLHKARNLTFIVKKMVRKSG